MHRLTTWLWVLDSYASFSIHQRILADVIAAKRVLNLDCTEELVDFNSFNTWHLAFEFDGRSADCPQLTLNMSKRPAGGFTVGPLKTDDGWIRSVEFPTLDSAFEEFFVYVCRHTQAPFRLIWHPFREAGYRVERIGDESFEPSHPERDDRFEPPACCIRDWSDLRSFYNDELRNMRL